MRVSGRDAKKGLAEQARTDGKSVCFLEANDTEIPALQNWCHTLTLAGRERAKTAFLAQFEIFIDSMYEFFSRDHGATEAECEIMRAAWESPYRKKMDSEQVLLEWDEPLTPLSDLFDDDDAAAVANTVGLSARLRKVSRLLSFITIDRLTLI